MSSDWRTAVEQMIEYLGKAVKYTTGLSRQEFDRQDAMYDAVCRVLELAGEAAKKIPDDMRDQHPDIPWRRLAQFRDVLAHDYARLESEIIWDAAVNRAPVVQAQLIRLLGESRS